MLKRIAVLTSGGGSPGMNAAIQAVVRVAVHEGVDVWGVQDGYTGLLEDRLISLNLCSVSDIWQLSGSILGNACCEEFKTSFGLLRALGNLRSRRIEGLIVIGGAGSLTGARSLATEGLPVVGLPSTVENDLWGIDYSIGFDTTVNTVIDAIEKMRITSMGHSRVIVVEVMGRQSGWIALTAGMASGAEEILVPEMGIDLEKTINKLKRSRDAGRNSIVVVAEGVGNIEDLAQLIGAGTGMETQLSVLGRIQRDGKPSLFDRILAGSLAEKAVMGLLMGLSNVLLGYHDGAVVAVDLDEATEQRNTLDIERFRVAAMSALSKSGSKLKYKR